VSRDDKGDLYLEPEKFISRIVSVIVLLKYNILCSSFIIQVKAAEILASGIPYILNA
jgi:hypothetical protein